MSEVIVQTIKKSYPSEIDTGIAYYRFITAINNMKISNRMLQLLSFINFRGTISSSSARKDFCTMFNSSEATIANMVSVLYELELLVKEKSKTKINPALAIDFSKDLVVRLFLITEKPVIVVREPELEEEEVQDGD